MLSMLFGIILCFINGIFISSWKQPASYIEKKVSEVRGGSVDSNESWTQKPFGSLMMHLH